MEIVFLKQVAGEYSFDAAFNIDGDLVKLKYHDTGTFIAKWLIPA